MFELWQSFSDDALTECPQTHDGESDPCGAPVRKVFSKVGISFKGDGFYKNDHGSSSKPPRESASDSSPSNGDSSSTKSDSPKSESTKSESTKTDSTTKSSTTSTD